MSEAQQEVEVPQPKTLADEANDLQKLIAQGMPTDTEMRTGVPRTVQRHLDWQRKNKHNIVRYQDIRKSIPTLPSIESLRLP